MKATAHAVRGRGGRSKHAKAAKSLARSDADSSLQRQIDRLRVVEKKAEAAYGEARVKAALGKLEAKDAVNSLMNRIDRIKNGFASLRNSASDEAADVLGKLGDACLELKKRLAR